MNHGQRMVSELNRGWHVARNPKSVVVSDSTGRVIAKLSGLSKAAKQDEVAHAKMLVQSQALAAFARQYLDFFHSHAITNTHATDNDCTGFLAGIAAHIVDRLEA